MIYLPFYICWTKSQLSDEGIHVLVPGYETWNTPGVYCFDGLSWFLGISLHTVGTKEYEEEVS